MVRVAITDLIKNHAGAEYIYSLFVLLPRHQSLILSIIVLDVAVERLKSISKIAPLKTAKKSKRHIMTGRIYTL